MTNSSNVMPPETKHRTVLFGGPRTGIDWRNHNGKSYVTGTKDQMSCGCCFAFASAAVLEYSTSLTSLSPQHLMDCTSEEGMRDDGCGGGLMEHVFEYAREHPVVTERDASQAS